MSAHSKGASGINIESSDIRLLAAIGFLSARSGLSGHASNIFEGLLASDQQKPFAYIGLALTSLCVGEYANAVSILKERGLKKFPDNKELLAWLAIALHYSGKSNDANEIILCNSLFDDEGIFSDLLKKIFFDKARLSSSIHAEQKIINSISSS